MTPSNFLLLSPINGSLDEYLALLDFLNHCIDLYYNDSVSEISDDEFDRLFLILQQIESKHPEWTSNNSPTQSLKNQQTKLSEFVKAKHKIPLLSLENTYSEVDLLERDESLRRVIWKIDDKQNDFSYYIEPKYDGISVELIYNNGTLIQAITRWDGFEWEDITLNVWKIASLVKNIPYLPELRVRWEIVMPKSAFEKLNEERAKKWESLFANPRNAASGTIKQLDSAVVADRWLVCYVYDIL